MRVTLVSLRPTAAAEKASRPALTPELLAATGARYSRSGAGLDAILARIDPADPDRSVDTIFRMIDYGHQSIADMAPVAIFIDGISIWLACRVWSLAPLAGGQESSTRYIRISADGLVDPRSLGIPEALQAAWQEAMGRAFDLYAALLDGWQRLAREAPEHLPLPPGATAGDAEQDRRKIERLRRNFAFDRARYLLPSAAATNMMMVMSARAWAALCRHLGSSPLAEARRLADAIRAELRLGAPRLLRHAGALPSLTRALQEELEAAAALAARRGVSPHLAERRLPAAHAATARLDVLVPPGVTGADFARDLRAHENRYAWIGDGLRRTAVRFGWDAVAFAEIRDLNRHRTGSKHFPPLPLGFYAAEEQLPAADDPARRLAPAATLAEAIEAGRETSLQAHRRLAEGDATCVYWSLLGTQFAFEHLTTADKFIYEAELRTGAGAHFRYARHLREVLALWHERFPETRGAIIEGAAEPE